VFFGVHFSKARMEFEITHITRYEYGHPAAEAYGEARLTPPNLPTQTIVSHQLLLDPETATSSYVDHYGNTVHFFSLPFRHKNLVVTNRVVARTSPPVRPAACAEVCVQEARQIFSSSLTDVFDYLQPTEIVETGKESIQWARKYLSGEKPLGESLQRLNEAIYEGFVYKQGVTEISTPLGQVWKARHGVCQDFAHVALSIVRTAGLPARYVCGYIEADPPRSSGEKPVRRLTGALATHAWIEVLAPGMQWVAIDPTNRQWCDERYVAVSYGRDYRDATPLRGTFKGSGGQKMSVKVYVKRRSEKAIA
jgi:transglutaminase-like putative cysteine protease